MSLFLDLWHACHIFNFIKIHEPNTIKIIPHIYLAALTFHIASRIRRHIQLSCFGVSLPFMSCVAFLSFLCFDLCDCCLLDFSEHLLSLLCMLACRSIVSVFIHISLLSHASPYFAWMVTVVTTHFKHMHAFPFYESCDCCLHE